MGAEEILARSPKTHSVFSEMIGQGLQTGSGLTKAQRWESFYGMGGHGLCQARVKGGKRKGKTKASRMHRRNFPKTKEILYVQNWLGPLVNENSEDKFAPPLIRWRPRYEEENMGEALAVSEQRASSVRKSVTRDCDYNPPSSTSPGELIHL